MTERRWSWTLPAFVVAHLAIFLGLFRTLYTIPYSGASLYFSYADKTFAGQLPYRDFVLEYPPVALAVFALPRVFASTFNTYYYAFHVEILLFDVAILGALTVAARRWSLTPWRVLAAYTIAILAVGPISIEQFDIAPALFALLAVIAFVDEREGLAGIFLALGVMTKIYPILLAPLFVLVVWKRGRVSRLTPAIGLFATTCLVCLLPWIARAPKSLVTMVTYHTKRGIHLDSMWATVAFIERALNLTWVDNDFSFASWNVVGPGVSALVPISTVALLAVLTASYVWFFRHLDRAIHDDRIDPFFLARGCAVVILGSMAASKVFSPQYLLWPIPFLVLLDGTRQRVALAVFVATGVITYWGYPIHYQDYIDHRTYMIVAFGLRNVLIAGLAVYLARAAATRAPAAVAEIAA